MNMLRLPISKIISNFLVRGLCESVFVRAIIARK